MQFSIWLGFTFLSKNMYIYYGVLGQLVVVCWRFKSFYICFDALIRIGIAIEEWSWWIEEWILFKIYLRWWIPLLPPLSKPIKTNLQHPHNNLRPNLAFKNLNSFFRVNLISLAAIGFVMLCSVHVLPISRIWTKWYTSGDCNKFHTPNLLVWCISSCFSSIRVAGWYTSRMHYSVIVYYCSFIIFCWFTSIFYIGCSWVFSC